MSQASSAESVSCLYYGIAAKAMPMTDEQLAAMHRLISEYHRRLVKEAVLDVVQQYHSDLAQRLSDEAALIPRRTAIVERLHEREQQKKTIASERHRPPHHHVHDAVRCACRGAAPMMTHPARLTVIIGPQCSWNNHPWVLRICRMSERYRRLVRQRCCCRASRLAGAGLQLLAHH